MKKLLSFFLVATVLLGPLSCSKDDPKPATPAVPALPSAPEAKAEHNNKSGGLYKGTFANAASSGTIKVVLQDGKTEIIIVYNGTSRTLTTTDLAGWTSGQVITNALFTSTDWQAQFSADADAANFSLGLDLAGTNDFDGLLIKETSTDLVRIYEGSYAGDASGKWNFGTLGNLLAGVYTGTSSGSFDGTISGTAITITSSGSLTASGTFNADMSTCSGAWTGSSTGGSWSGTRKL